MQHNQQVAHTPLPASKQGPSRNRQNALSFKRVANAVRFVIRIRMMARAWRKQEQLRKTLLAQFEEQEAQEAQSNVSSEFQPHPLPKPVITSKPIAIGQNKQHQIKVKHIEQLLQQSKKTAEHLRFGGAMSVDLEASSSTARDEDHPHGVDAHHNHGYTDVGADSAAEMWMSGDEVDGHGLWRREDFAAPPPLQSRVEDFDGTEAISVDSN